MSDDIPFRVDSDAHDTGPLTPEARNALLPQTLAYGVGMAAVVVAVVLSVVAPDTLAAIGGWATPISIVVLSSGVGAWLSLRRLRAYANRPDEAAD